MEARTRQLISFSIKGFLIRTFFSFLGISLGTLHLSGQIPDTSQYDFIRYEKNKLSFPNGIQSYAGFYQKLQQLTTTGKGQLNIMHIGGSHVQAGVWTQALCSAFKYRFPTVPISRGLIFPYQAVGTTQPVDYYVTYGGFWQGCRNVQRRLDCPLGLMGISASTVDSNAFLLLTSRGGSAVPFRFTQVKIFHAVTDSSYVMSFPNDSLATITRDSVNHYSLVVFSKEMDTLFLQMFETAPEQKSFELYGFRMEPDSSGVCIDAIGNNGADLPSYLRCDLFDEQLKAALPDLVILSLGINDAYTRQFNDEQYKNNYRALIAKIRTASPECAILFTTNNDSYYRKRYPNLNGPRVQQAIFELAAEYDAGVWDLFDVMGGQRSINRWVSARLARTDRIHFTNSGYQLIGGLLSEALVNAFIEYQSQLPPGD